MIRLPVRVGPGGLRKGGSGFCTFIQEITGHRKLGRGGAETNVGSVQVSKASWL